MTEPPERDMSAQASPLDAARQQTRAAPRRRFYERAALAVQGDAFAVELDGKPLRTPARHALAVPSRAIAERIAAEWNAQGDTIAPRDMPLTRLANTVIDGVSLHAGEVRSDIGRYFESDALFYRAEHPQALVARQAAAWDPLVRWAAEAVGARFILVAGIIHARQPDTALAAARDALPDDIWSLGALHAITSISGSALLALALARGAIAADAAWAAAHVDEDWNIAQWGEDAEAAARRAARRAEFDAAAFVLSAL